MVVERDVVVVIGGGEGQYGVFVIIGGDGFLVGEGYIFGVIGVNQDDSVIYFWCKDYFVVVNQNVFVGVVVQMSGL